MSVNLAELIGDIPSHFDAGPGPNILVDYAEIPADQYKRAVATNVVIPAAGAGIFSWNLRDALAMPLWARFFTCTSPKR